MSKQKKDQSSNSPSIVEESNDLHTKKFNLTETKSSNNGGNEGFFFPMNKKMKLKELKKEAYFNVLYAFNAESSPVSKTRRTIIEVLKNELNIAHRTHTAFEDKLKTDPLIQQSREDSDKERKLTAKEETPKKLDMKLNKEDLLSFQERLNIAPAKIKREKANDSSIIPGWGQTNPASLVNRWISLKPPREDEYFSYLIQDYNPNTEMHHLVPPFSRKGVVDPCNWIDLRHISVDTEWKEGHPGYPTRTCLLKPGETVLYETSTARTKKPIKEIGKTASGIPILQRKLDKRDKGKGIAM